LNHDLKPVAVQQGGGVWPGQLAPCYAYTRPCKANDKKCRQAYFTNPIMQGMS